MIGQDTYLLICDYYSKFPFVYSIKGKVTSDAIVFKIEGIGKFRETFRETFHITLDPTVTPVVHASRRCPIHIKEEVKNEINHMVDLDVIEKVDEPTDWVSSIVFSRCATFRSTFC